MPCGKETFQCTSNEKTTTKYIRISEDKKRRIGAKRAVQNCFWFSRSEDLAQSVQCKIAFGFQEAKI